jgi:hypothetical protein
MHSPRFKNANFRESKNGPRLILGAGIFRINPTPQQSADIFKKNTFVRSLSSWHPQSNSRAEATAAVHSDNASKVGPTSIPPSIFYITNVGTVNFLTTSQPETPESNWALILL